MDKIGVEAFENTLMEGGFECVYILRDSLREPSNLSIRKRLDYLMHGRLTSALEEVGSEKIPVFLSGINEPKKGMLVLEPGGKVKGDKVLAHLEGLRPKSVCFLGASKDLLHDIESRLKESALLQGLERVAYIQHNV